MPYCLDCRNWISIEEGEYCETCEEIRREKQEGGITEDE